MQGAQVATNRIYCQSSERMEQLPDGSVALIVTSPPYGVKMEYEVGQTFDDWLTLMQRVFRECDRVLMDGGRVCINVANTARNPYRPLTFYLYDIIFRLAWLPRGEIIWDKHNMQNGGNHTAWGSWCSASNPTLRDHHEYCNPPESLVWMGDYSFKPIGDVMVGDEVIGWFFDGKTRKLTRTLVMAKSERKAPCVKLVFDDSEIECTADHQWAQHNGKPGDGKLRWAGFASWREYRTARPGVKLLKIIDPTVPLATSQQKQSAAYLAGIYDGEGHGTSISQSRDHNPCVRSRIVACLDELGLPSSRDDMNIHIRVPMGYGGRRRGSGRQRVVDFLNWTCPVRKITRENDRLILNTMNSWEKPVVDVVPGKTQDVVALQTWTGNYVVHGFGSKNCLIFSKGRMGREKQSEGDDSITRDDFLTATRSIWKIQPASATRLGHPAPFPIELPRRLIELYSFRGDLILDPFCGSGTTLLAAKVTGRRWVGYDKEPRYCQLAENRLAELWEGE